MRVARTGPRQLDADDDVLSRGLLLGVGGTALRRCAWDRGIVLRDRDIVVLVAPDVQRRGRSGGRIVIERDGVERQRHRHATFR